MKRRLFVKASILASAIPAYFNSKKLDTRNITKNNSRLFYELKIYSLKNNDQKKKVLDHYQKAAIPTYNKYGCNPIGVFTELKPEASSKIYVLIPYKSIDDFLKVSEKIINDSDYRINGANYLYAEPKEPAYERIESSLLHAFEHYPNLSVPEKKSRIFELRRYESPNELAGKKKIEMFNNAGEIDIFKKNGLTPVFFGETMVGSSLPNLTYMITFENMDAHDANWKKFGSDPEWKKLSTIPEYTDAKIISHINSTFLIPADFSQI